MHRIRRTSEEFIESCGMCIRSSVFVLFRAFLVFDSSSSQSGKEFINVVDLRSIKKKNLFLFFFETLPSILACKSVWIDRIHPKAVLITSQSHSIPITFIIFTLLSQTTSEVGFCYSTMVVAVFVVVVISCRVAWCEFYSVIRMKVHQWMNHRSRFA